MKQITDAEFESEVLGSREPVLVDFYTDSCSPCRRMAPVLQEMEAESDGRFKVVKVEAAAEMQLAAAYRVKSVPSFLAFVNGQCVAQTVGEKSKAHMQKWIQDALLTA